MSLRRDFTFDSWMAKCLSLHLRLLRPPWGRGLLPYKRLMGMCCWMGSHFHDWNDYHGVAFSIELREWGRIVSDFWGKTILHI